MPRGSPCERRRGADVALAWGGWGVGGLFTRTRAPFLRKSGARVWASPTSRRYDRIIGANGFWLPSELALDFFAELSFRLWQMGERGEPAAATVYENYDKKGDDTEQRTFPIYFTYEKSLLDSFHRT